MTTVFFHGHVAPKSSQQHVRRNTQAIEHMFLLSQFLSIKMPTNSQHADKPTHKHRHTPHTHTHTRTPTTPPENHARTTQLMPYCPCWDLSHSMWRNTAHSWTDADQRCDAESNTTWESNVVRHAVTCYMLRCKSSTDKHGNGHSTEPQQQHWQ